MKKNVFGKKLKRDTNERKALFKSLMSSFILSERIQTTEAKAKSIRPEIEKLVTKAKKNETSAKEILQKVLPKPALDKLINELAPRFSKRQGGYTRIIRLRRRLGDDAPLVIMEWTEKAQTDPVVKIKPVKTKARKIKPVKIKKTLKKSK